MGVECLDKHSFDNRWIGGDIIAILYVGWGGNCPKVKCVDCEFGYVIQVLSIFGVWRQYYTHPTPCQSVTAVARTPNSCHHNTQQQSISYPIVFLVQRHIHRTINWSRTNTPDPQLITVSQMDSALILLILPYHISYNFVSRTRLTRHSSHSHFLRNSAAIILPYLIFSHSNTVQPYPHTRTTYHYHTALTTTS